MHISPEKATQLSRYRVREGDMLFSRMATVGRAGYVTREFEDTIFNYHLMRLRLDSSKIHPLYFVYWVRGADEVEQHVRDVNHGATRDGINTKQLLALPIALPPLEHQHRIVEAIETQFTRLDAAVAALKRVQANLRRYRASVLKAACEGRLVPTEAELARAEGRAYEPAAVLLARILAERRRKWEAVYPGKKYKEPAGPDVSGLPELPEGWCWARVQQVGEVQLGRQRAPKYHDGPYMRPYLRVANVFEDRIDVRDVLQMNFDPSEYEVYQLKYGDILLNEGQSPELLGRPALYREEVPGACFQNTLIRFRTSAAVLPEFALAVFRGYMHSGRFQRIGQITTNLAHLGAGRFAEVEFPLPPLAEQVRITDELERQLSLVRQLEETVKQNQKRGSNLRKSVLQDAFVGRIAHPNQKPPILRTMVDPAHTAITDNSLAA